MIKFIRMEWLGFATNWGGLRNPYEILFRRFYRKKLCGKHRHRWKYDVKLALMWYIKPVMSYVWTNRHVLVTCIIFYDVSRNILSRCEVRLDV